MKYSAAADRNKTPILECLRELLPAGSLVLEVGSGSGQHARHFTKALNVTWQPTDTAPYLPDLIEVINGSEEPNLLAPFELDADFKEWPAPTGKYDAVYTANTMHIMTAVQVERFFNHLPTVLKSSGQLLVYGPFLFDGQFTSESNLNFDQQLKSRSLGQAIRDAGWLEELAALSMNFRLIQRHDLPANNQLLVFTRG